MKQLIFDNTDLFRKPIGITNRCTSLTECPNDEADNIIMKYHYSRKATPNRFMSMRINDGDGYIQLGYGIRPHMKHAISKHITTKNYCEFDRMWLSDDMPKNSESQTIALLLSYLRQVYSHIKFVITYADGSVGNRGIIYQATNAFYVGKVPVDFYILPSGERVHPVSMYHRHKTRAWSYLQEQYPGIKHIKGTEWQYRYLYILHNGMRRKYQGRYATNQVEGLGQFQHSAPR